MTTGLDFKLVDVKFVQGVETQENKKLVIPGKWNALENCTLSADGSVSKRDGIQTLSNTSYATTTPTVGSTLALFNDQLLKLDKSTLSSTDVLGANQSVAFPQQFGFVDVRQEPVFRSSTVQDSIDCAAGHGASGDPVKAFVWRDRTAALANVGISVSVMDAATSALKIPVTQLRLSQFAYCPRIVFQEGAFFVFYIDSSTNSLYCVVIYQDGTSWTVGAETALITSVDLDTTQNFDACPFVGDLLGSVGVSYAWKNGVTSVRAIRVTRTGVTPSITAGPTNLISEAQLPVANLCGIGVCPMFINGQNTYYATFTVATGATACSGTSTRICDANLSPIAAAAQIDASIPLTTAPTHVCAIGDPVLPKAVVFTDEQSRFNLDTSVTGVLPIRRTIISTNGVAVTILASGTLINSAIGNSGGPSTKLYPQGPFIAGKPFGGAWDEDAVLTKLDLQRDRLFLPVWIGEKYTISANTNSQQNSWFLLDGVTGKVVAKALYGSYGIAAVAPNAPTVSTPCSSPLVSFTDLETNELKTFNLVGVQEQSATLALASGIDQTLCGVSSLALTTGAAESDFFGPAFQLPAAKNAQLGPVQYFAGGCLSQFDTTAITEMGFPLFPEGIFVTNIGAGGAMTAGVHQVVAIYEWYDGAGQRHQSAPSLPVSITVAANDRITVRIPTLLLSQKTGVSLVAFMTLANQQDFYRVTPISSPVLNITTDAFIVVTVTNSDASIAGNELLYHQPGQPGTELRNLAPGPCSTIAIHQNRLWIDQTDKKGVYRYSQPLNSRDGLQWNVLLTGTVPSDGGAITGLVSLDSLLVILCERKLYRVDGTGPNLAGLNSFYGSPVEIPSDTGCVFPKSILKTAEGITFKSLKGWYLLTRDLQVRYIGGPVKAYDYQNVTAAQYVGDKQEARFHTDTIVNDALGLPQCVQLVYSYVQDQWSTAQVFCLKDVDGDVQISRMPVGDALWWPAQKSYFYISETGFQRDVAGAEKDIPTDALSPLYVEVPVMMKARTSFLHLTPLEGFQRVRWLYLTGSASQAPIGELVITVDFDDVWQDVTPPGAPNAYRAQFNLGGASFAPSFDVDLRHKLHRQKCKSVSFTFSEIPPPESGTHLTGFQAMLLEVGTKRGTNKLPAAKSVP